MLWRWLEWSALFVALPLLLLLVPVNRLAVLSLVTLYAVVMVVVHRPRFTVWGEAPALQTMLRIPLVVGLIFLYSRLAFPADFLSLPDRRPWLWLLILAFYPLVSVLPQEFLYRRFYFWRYRRLFPSSALMLGSNVLLFSFMHIVYDNPVAVGMSMIGGALLSTSYQANGRLLPVWLEHSIYGLAIFTSGLGYFFYKPLS